MNGINKIEIPQTVKIRKYPVNIFLLQAYLRNRKLNLGLTNKDIAEKLEIPLTTVEHWFRKDSCFSIPEPNIWFKLKEILYFNTDMFDESIMTFEEKEGVFDDGIAPTLTQQQDKFITNLKIRKLTPLECWRLMGFDDSDFEKAKNVPTSNAQLYKQAGNSIVVNVLEKIFRNLLKV